MPPLGNHIRHYTISVGLYKNLCITLDLLLESSEVDIQLVKMLQEDTERSALSHLGKSVYILGKTLASIAKLAIGTGNVGVSVIDIAGEEHTGVHLAPIAAHLLAIFTAGIEISHLVRAKHIVHVLCQLSFERSHHGKLLAYEYLCEQFMSTCEYHCLLLEILDVSALGEEFGHIAHLMPGLARQHIACSRENGSSHKDRHIWQFLDKLFHEGQVLCAIILSRYMNLQKCNIYVTQIIIIPFRRVADKQFTLGIVVLQPILQGSAYEATSNNSNVNHLIV